MENQVLRVIQCLAEDIGTPRALAVKLLAESGEWLQLQQLKVDLQDYICRPDRNDSESFWKDCLITDLLRKCDLQTEVDREAGAIATFEACERLNARTNARLHRYLPQHLFIEDGDEPVSHFISDWRKDVIALMGNLPDHLTPRFSPGATYADTGLLITTPDKMSSTPTIYSEWRCILPHWQETSWFRALAQERPYACDPKTVRGNLFFTVPKDGTKFRGCCKEASINVTYQLAVGKHLKSRLKRVGIDLLHGQDEHRRLARSASERDDLATIDMSNASDTLCRVLVQLLLRGDWWELLNSLRAPMTRVGGRWFRLEKFSSMGNGFTFELETIVFATLARAVISKEGGDPDLVKCYGDDLIVPVEHYRSVVSALRLFGFEPNERKTFAEGPFRESCGGDFWKGVPVRAHFLKELPDEPQHWISLANGLRRVALANDGDSPRWMIVRRAWLRALDPIPSHIRRCRGPEHLGDIVIHDRPDAWGYTTRRPTGFDPSWDETYIEAWCPVPSVLPWYHWSPSVQLASCTLGLSSDGITPRGGVAGYKKRVVNARLTNAWLPSAWA